MSRVLILLLSVLVSVQAFADEGMWTFDNFPAKEVKNKYGVQITSGWLEHARLSSVRLANGCSGSFISSEGLVLTNHHCVVRCVEQLSTAKKDYMAKGFLAKDKEMEINCPALEVNRLVEITDVTKKVQASTKNLKGEAFTKARKASIAQLEKECSEGKQNMRCDVITLYNGGRYNLYKYQRYQDVRLVFAPESAAAAFGGDPDNFNFPRYCLDFSLLRVYENNKPLVNKHFFKWSDGNIKENDVTFVTGHPGRTSRLLTVAELEDLRDYALLDRIVLLSEMRGMLTEFQKKGKEQKRIASATLQGVENGLKVLKGQQEALVDQSFFNSLVKKEKDLQKKIAQNPRLRKQYGQVFSEIKNLSDKTRLMSDDIMYIWYNTYGSQLFRYAQWLVQASEELKKPDSERFEEYTESRLPQLKQQLFSKAPVYKELEQTLMEFYLIKTREALSPDHPFVKKILGTKSPAEVAKNLIKKSSLTNIKAREKLFEGGAKAIAQSNDPMIQFAKLVDKDVRAVRKNYENNIQSALKAANESLAAAKFSIYGTDTYPDATFSLRMSYGQVKGYKEGEKTIAPFTYVKDVFKRNTGSEPFALPVSWMNSKEALQTSKAPYNFVSTNDIIGGNSGSPILNKEAQVIGVVFDGNIHSLGGAFGFDPQLNRTVSVHSSAMLEALKTVYNADHILKEIKDTKTLTTKKAPEKNKSLNKKAKH